MQTTMIKQAILTALWDCCKYLQVYAANSEKGTCFTKNFQLFPSNYHSFPLAFEIKKHLSINNLWQKRLFHQI